MPDLKEPHFFNFFNKSISPHPDKEPWTISDYASLFRQAKPNQLLGEASACYLYYHDEVIPTIFSIYKKNAEKIKIIIILRNPIDRAWSYFQLLKRSYPKINFYDAVGKYCNDETRNFHNFIQAGHYAKQVENYIKNFGSVKIFLFEELKANPELIINKILLNFDLKNKSFVPMNLNLIYNASGASNSFLTRHIFNFLYQNNALKQTIKPIFPAHFRYKFKAKLSPLIMNKEPMPYDVRCFLRDKYKDSIKTLQSTLSSSFQKAIVKDWAA
jgi:hypothetical protein